MSAPKFLGQGQSPTTVLDGDVTIGLKNAIRLLENTIGYTSLNWDYFFVTCSAAGGLNMTVHGIVHDMTVKAGMEAAMGAGAVVRFITSGEISDFDIKKIEEIKPTIILLTGGVDYGEREGILRNAQKLALLDVNTDIIFAGNRVLKPQIEEIFNYSGKKVIFTENVYPNIDELNILPTKKKIYETFEKNIVKAPGMEKIQDYSTHPIVPTPLSVMDITEMISNELSDVLVIDVGGATTDIHSVTEGDKKYLEILINPEPRSKRTVEGDLGVYINQKNILDRMTSEEIKLIDSLSRESLADEIYPLTEDKVKYINYLSYKAIQIALDRHAGNVKYEYLGSGRIAFCEGKDLTKIKHVIGTGGVLSKLMTTDSFIKDIFRKKRPEKLLPNANNVRYFRDKNYIMFSLGMLSQFFPLQTMSLFYQNIISE